MRKRGDNGYSRPGGNGASSYVGRLDFFALGFFFDGGLKMGESSSISGELASPGPEKRLAGGTMKEASVRADNEGIRTGLI